MTDENPRIAALKEKIADLKKRWPAHTPPPALMQQLDDLEAELAAEVAKQEGRSGDA
jgi:hypothetical protein